VIGFGPSPMASLRVQRDAFPLPPGTVACIGAFDGFHLGHQALLARARRYGEHVAVVTFDPHPLQVVAPTRAPKLLQSLVQRERVAAWLGLDALVVLPFDPTMATLAPEAFARQYLSEGLRPVSVVVGEDFRFGVGRSGTPARLGELLQNDGIPVHVVAPIACPESSAGRKLSSTNIREALERGDVRAASHMLGRFHSVNGRVVEGARRGRLLGFPTANIDFGAAFLPPPGVYASALTVWQPGVPDGGACWPSATSLGRNQTFVEDGPMTLEVYVIDQNLDERLYGLEVEVSFIEHLRGQMKFDTGDALIEQMRHDVEEARRLANAAALQQVLRPGTLRSEETSS